MSNDNKLILPCDVSEVSDGYHTFAELYDHRCLIFINLALAHKDIAFKTWRNKEGDKWMGWFILGLNTSQGQISYHLPTEYWDIVTVPEIERNVDYDGHTAYDVVIRLKALAETGGL